MPAIFVAEAKNDACLRTCVLQIAPQNASKQATTKIGGHRGPHGTRHAHACTRAGPERNSQDKDSSGTA